MRPLTLIQEFYIIQAKCTYGFNQTPLISMNPNLALATVVSSNFLTKPNYQSNQMILYQNSIQQFQSKAKSSTLSCNMFKNLKLAQVSSTENMLYPFTITYMKWATYNVQQKFNLTTFLPTSSSMTQLYNADTKICTWTFIGFVIDAKKIFHFH